jgi:protein-S-isoprenylcysteine O-methyltransferase Ste14
MLQNIYTDHMLLWLMLAGIIVIKIIWLRTEITYFKQRMNATMYRTNFIEAVILFLQVYVVYVFPLPVTSYDRLITWIGILMYAGGIILALWARDTMKHSWGIPGEHAKQQDTLVVRGPFKISRNPIYVGFALIYLGFCVAIQSWMIILRVPLLWYFYKSVLQEEKLLEKNFGEKYVKYKRQVPRFLFL